MAPTDSVQHYAAAKGLEAGERTVLVEGSSDVAIFQLAATLERKRSGADLFANGFVITAAGEGDAGGTHGVIRELVCLRGIAMTCLMSNGRPRYRFIGLFDNDQAGRRAIPDARRFDGALLEYRDLFRLRPVMPRGVSRDAESLKKHFEVANAAYKGLDWELEDMFSRSFVDAFCEEEPEAVRGFVEVHGRIHRELTHDGKARLHHFAKKHAMADDLSDVLSVLHAIRYYVGLPAVGGGG